MEILINKTGDTSQCPRILKTSPSSVRFFVGDTRFELLNKTLNIVIPAKLVDGNHKEH
jgi:hypothetical protein